MIAGLVLSNISIGIYALYGYNRYHCMSWDTRDRLVRSSVVFSDAFAIFWMVVNCV